ncbi:hypothetical protein Btru_075468 [Bulinus truncatus]|nr:hypothetical protein Btru_075468 [Bulinus truncatus]
MDFFYQLLVLFWKNLLLRRRMMPFIELAFQVLIMVLIFITRMHYHPSKELDITLWYNVSTPLGISVQQRGSPYGKYSGHVLIGYAPASKAAENLMNKVRHLFIEYGLPNSVTDVQMVSFHSEYSMMEYVEKYPSVLQHSYVFTPTTVYTENLPKQLKVIIRPVQKFDWMGWGGNPGYHSTGELYVMKLIVEAFTDSWSGGHPKKFNIYTREVWRKPVRHDPMLDRHIINRLTSYIILLSTIYVGRFVYNMAKEREHGILNNMINIGVSSATYWLSWYLWMLLIFNIACFFICVILVCPLVDVEPIFALTSPGLVFFHFFTFSGALSAYCVLGSVLFIEPKACVAVSCFLFISLVYLLGMANSPWGTLNLLVNINLYNGLTMISMAEKMGEGIQLDTIYHRPANFHFSFLELELLKGVAVLLYLGLAWILFNFVTYGHLLKQGWLLKNKKDAIKSGESINKDFVKYQEKCKDQNLAISIDKLTVLGQHDLFNVSLNLYEGQVTVLVSGSGRNPIVDILAGVSNTYLYVFHKGVLAPTYGTVTVYGKDVVKNKKEVLQMSSIGMHDQLALYSHLTVWENLRIFSYLKQFGQEKKSINLDKLTEEFGLQNILDKRVKNLKPSDKSMLQAAITLAGTSKIIALQEPTLDMDSANLHTLCDIISRWKQNRAIIVSTKSFELAEKIGDWLVFFVGGHIICSGSVGFLRTLLGAGYYLSVVLTLEIRSDRIKRIVRMHIPEATIVEEKPGVIMFLLPFDSTPLFYGLFSEFERKKTELMIDSFSVNAKTIDEGFKRLLYKSKRKDNKLSDLLSETTLCSYSPAVHKFIKERLSADQGQQIYKYIPSPSETNMLNTVGSAVDESPSRKSSKRHTTESEIKETFSPLFLAIKRTLGKAPVGGSVNTGFNQRGSWDEDPHYLQLYTTSMAEDEILTIRAETNTNSAQYHGRRAAPGGVRVALIVCLAYAGSKLEAGGLSDSLSLSAYHAVQQNAFISVSPGRHVNNASRRLVENFKAIVSVNGSTVNEYDDRVMSVEEVLMERNKLHSLYGFGAVFNQGEKMTDMFEGTVWYSESPDVKYTELPVAVAAILNTFLRTSTGDNHYVEFEMLPAWLERDLEAKFYQSHMAYDISQKFMFIMTIALFFVPYMLVYENKIGMKHLQYLSGVTPIMYWSVHFLFDLISYLMLCYVYWASMLLFGSVEASAIKDYLALVFFLNGLMMLPYHYTIQLFFQSPPLAVFTVLSMNYVLDNCTKSWDSSIFYRHDYLALTYPGVGVNLIAMMFHALFWTVLLMLIEYGCLRDLWSFISSKLKKKQPPKKRDDCCDVKAFSPFESYYVPFCSINSLTDAGQSESGPDVVIKCEELSVSKRDSAGVVELNLDIGQSEVFCIVGSDSRTTSAVLDVMSGRKSATSGRVLIRGVPVNPLNLDRKG